jgi:ribosomal protein S18 acetylase RimI-like enzyme
MTRQPEDLDVRRAAVEDLGTILDLLAEGARYARTLGVDQWPERFPEELIFSGIERNEVFAGVIGGVVVSTLSLTWSDEVFWGSDDSQAGYVHRLAVSSERRGVGLGRRLLDWAQTEVDRADRDHLRLDCLASNAALRKWYESVRFVHQRDREVRGPLGTPVEISLYQRRMPPR